MKVKKERDRYKKLLEEHMRGEHDTRRTATRDEANEVAKLRSDLKRCQGELDKERRKLEEARERITQLEIERRALQSVPMSATADTANRYRQQVTEQLHTIKKLELDKQRLETKLVEQIDRAKTLEAENTDLHSEVRTPQAIAHTHTSANHQPSGNACELLQCTSTCRGLPSP